MADVVSVDPVAVAVDGAPASPDAPKAPKPSKGPAHFEDKDGLFKTVCRSFMTKKCKHGASCKHVHDSKLCAHFWKSGVCKFDDKCRKNHFVTVAEKNDAGEAKADVTDVEASESEVDAKKKKKKKEAKGKTPKESKSKDTVPAANGNEHANGKENGNKKDGKKKQLKSRSSKKNTECFEPMTRPVDLRVTYDLGNARDTFSTSLTTRDVLLAPNLFSDFKKGELYAKLVAEIESCGVPPERLLKMWHGNDKLDGTHLIADDKTRWKNNCPTFDLVIDRIKKFFKMSVKATRFNWYKDTSQWKPFHFDAAAVKPEIAAIQNFTVGISFGATRDAAFEHADTKTVVSIPQPDGCVYAFARDTNIIWRHGILQDTPVREEGRISVIAWGWIDGMVDPDDAVTNTP